MAAFFHNFGECIAEFEGNVGDYDPQHLRKDLSVSWACGSCPRNGLRELRPQRFLKALLRPPIVCIIGLQQRSQMLRMLFFLVRYGQECFADIPL